MPLTQNDRIAFSASIVGADAKIAGIAAAQAQVAAVLKQVQDLDTAHKNLLDPVNALVNEYQGEMQKLDGNGRTSFAEQDIINAINKQQNNFFFPNNPAIVVPDLAGTNNVWTQIPPFAMSYGVGKSYVQTYSPVQKEGDLIAPCQTLITSAAANTDHDNTTGNASTSFCSDPTYTDQMTCELNGDTWTQAGQPNPNIHLLLTNLKNAVIALKTFVTAEAALIPTNDPNMTNQTNNNAAIANINTTLLGAINTWQALADFESTGVGPSKLHSTQLNALKTALTNRSTFITTRIGQISAVLGGIVQNLSNGSITSSTGLYGQRFAFLVLRIDQLTGSLTQLTGGKNQSAAQDNIKTSIGNNKATYQSFIQASSLKAPGNGTNAIHVKDISFLSVGDLIYLYADNQSEILRAVKSINNDTVFLNDVVSPQYDPSSGGRIYKVLV